MVTNEEIYKMFIENIKKLNHGDIYCENAGVWGGIGGIGLKFMSKTRKGKHGRKIFLYLVLCPNYVKIELNAGKNSEYKIYDPKSLIDPEPSHDGIGGKIIIRPKEFEIKYSKKDVDDIIKQFYEMLNLRK
jgi:hypothetical protein